MQVRIAMGVGAELVAEGSVNSDWQVLHLAGQGDFDRLNLLSPELSAPLCFALTVCGCLCVTAGLFPRVCFAK